MWTQYAGTDKVMFWPLLQWKFVSGPTSANSEKTAKAIGVTPMRQSHTQWNSTRQYRMFDPAYSSGSTDVSLLNSKISISA